MAACLLAACLSLPSIAQTPADPAAWGVLATLAGNRWQTEDGVVRSFEWSNDGRELIESEWVGGLPRPANVYSVQGIELVQHECVPGLNPCHRLTERFGTVTDDGVVFKAISVSSKKSDPSVALRERPGAADWGKWKRKYLFISETLLTYRLVGADRYEVVKTFTSKYTSQTFEEPWDAPMVEPAISYRHAGQAAQANVAAADFGPMEKFVGQRMISEDLGEILELQHAPDGKLIIQWFSLSGQPIGRYVFAATTNGDGLLELSDWPYVNSQTLKMKLKTGSWREGGKLGFLTQPEGSGRMMSHEFSLANGKIRTVTYETDLGTTLTGKPKVTGFSSGARVFVPATPELIAKAVAENERRLEEARQRAQLAAEERREREAQSAQNFSAFMGGLTTFANTYNETMADYRAQESRQQANLEDLRRQVETTGQAQQQAANNAEAQPDAQQFEQQRVPSTTRRAPTSTPAVQTPDAGRASTDTDANRCVTQSEIRENDTFKGNTAAYVVNGCDTPVDVRMCLMTESGWKCGATLGLAPQARWSHSAFHATGPVFVDARTTGSNRRFASPN